MMNVDIVSLLLVEFDMRIRNDDERHDEKNFMVSHSKWHLRCLF